MIHVDCNLVGNCVTINSRIGYTVFLNGAQAMEYVRGLRYTLHMLDIPVDVPSFVFGDNKLVLTNTTVPGLMIMKKMNSLSYVNTLLDCADLLTKSLPPWEKHSSFVRKFIYWIYDEKKTA